MYLASFSYSPETNCHSGAPTVAMVPALLLGFKALPRPKGDDPGAGAAFDLIKCEYKPQVFKNRIRGILTEVVHHYEEFAKLKADTDDALKAINDSAWKALFMRIVTGSSPS